MVLLYSAYSEIIITVKKYRIVHWFQSWMEKKNYNLVYIVLFLLYVSNIYLLIILFYFQWLGDDKLRRILEGKLVMIHLVCKKATNGSNASISSFTGATSAKDMSTPKRQIFRPCVALRIAGSPGKIYTKHI